MINSSELIEKAELILSAQKFCSIKDSSAKDLHISLSKVAVSQIYDNWEKTKATTKNKKSAYYFSAEFLMGRAVFSNFYNMGILDEVQAKLKEKGISITELEEIADDALGNGGLGRLAACFLDSAATHDIPLNGYGIRYKYGLFKQGIEQGFQVEYPDDWQRFDDPWSIRREDESVVVTFADQKVKAVPYDTPIIGYQTDTVNTLRLWQAEAVRPFDLGLFNRQEYDDAVKDQNDAQNISMVLYPNDDGRKGKTLRLKQQYFFSSASLQDLVRKHKANHGGDFTTFAKYNAVQLNDTHPTVSIPELIRILMDEEKVAFEDAFKIAQETFAYTNHTIMAEALEKWSLNLFDSILPRITEIIEMINDRLTSELTKSGMTLIPMREYKIIADGLIHMARLAIYATHSTNGVAKIHTQILKDTALNCWYKLYPERFINMTNGITQRRWLGLCNRQLTAYLGELGLGNFIKNLEEIKKLEQFKDDTSVLDRLTEIKYQKKLELAAFVKEKEGMTLNPDAIFDIQVKRLHEYKRQLLNAFSILDIYYGIKAGTVKDFQNTAFIFGAKAAPGYRRAKAIIKFIGCIAELVNNDKDMEGKMQVLFVSDYNVSYAEKLIPAADVSEQISTAGTEASGTGNMKFMLNGAVTLGTLDGANVEIVEQAGIENNYIFGAKVEEIAKITKTYNPVEIYESNKRLKRVMDTLIDGTFKDSGNGEFKELHDSLLLGASWHNPDNYFLLYDFDDYVKTKLLLNSEYKNKREFSQKCLMNIANSGTFSSDRTISQYSNSIWGIV